MCLGKILGDLRDNFFRFHQVLDSNSQSTIGLFSWKTKIKNPSIDEIDKIVNAYFKISNFAHKWARVCLELILYFIVKLVFF